MMSPVMRIDSHQHFWDLSKLLYPWMPPAPSVLAKNYLPEDLQPILASNQMDGCVTVQAAQVDAEAEWMLANAGRHAFIKGVVAWVDLKSPEVGLRLDSLRKNPKFVGVRHIVQDEPDNDWALQAEVVRGLRELERRDIPYDVLIKPPQLHIVEPLAAKLPRLRMVIDHIAKPYIKDRKMEPWARQMESIARNTKCLVKLSGMITEADHRAWRTPDLTPYVHHVYQAFGPDRCMFGSDWPVCLLAGTWKQVLAAMTQALGPLKPADRDRVMGETAARFYRLTA
jgi:L-fuconolactonase